MRHPRYWSRKNKLECLVACVIAPLAFGYSSAVSAQDFSIVLAEDGESAWRINTATGEVSFCEASTISEPPNCGPWGPANGNIDDGETEGGVDDTGDIDAASSEFTCAVETGANSDPTYYNSALGRTGDSLRAALNSIISDSPEQFSYDEVWDELRHSDEDPCDANNVILIYTGRSHLKSDRDAGQNDSDSWNREHVWPKSHGFPSRSQAAYTDIHHLRPADRSVNSSRGHKDFDDGGALHHESPETFVDRDSWEPRDAVKGDIARMIFYMAIRYEGDSSVPDLALVDEDTDSNEAQLGHLCTLLTWHRQDAVSNWEKRRNNRIHERQGNRNPFIDHPEWANDIWLASCPSLQS